MAQRIHFKYEVIQLSEFVECYNEPLFYFTSLSVADVETKDNLKRTPINGASSNGNNEVVQYLYETCHATVETKDNLNVLQ